MQNTQAKNHADLREFATANSQPAPTPPTIEEILEFCKEAENSGRKNSKNRSYKDINLFWGAVNQLKKDGAKKHILCKSGSSTIFYTQDRMIRHTDSSAILPKVAMQAIKKFKAEAVDFFDKDDRPSIQELAGYKRIYKDWAAIKNDCLKKGEPLPERVVFHKGSSFINYFDRVPALPTGLQVGKILEIDINQAYLTQAVKMGFCSPELHKYFNEALPKEIEKELKNTPKKEAQEQARQLAKKARLIALGTLAKQSAYKYEDEQITVSINRRFMQEKSRQITREIVTDSKGQEIKTGQRDAFQHIVNKITETQTEYIKDIFFYCAAAVTQLCQSIISQLPQEAFFFWVDAIFIKPEALEFVAQEIEKAGFAYKVKEWQGVEITQENKFLIYDADIETGELYAAKEYQFRKPALKGNYKASYFVEMLESLLKEEKSKIVTAEFLNNFFNSNPKKAEKVVKSFQQKTGIDLGEILQATLTFRNNLEIVSTDSSNPYSEAATTIETITEILHSKAEEVKLKKISFADFVNLGNKWLQYKDFSNCYDVLNETKTVEYKFS